jgi:aminopeptidase N
MKKTIPLLFLLSFTVSALFAQPQFTKGSDYCSYKKMHNPNPIFNLGDSPNTPKHKFDVLDYKLNLDIRSCFISPYPKSFTGVEIVKFRVDTALNSIQLYAVNTSLQINSVGMSGVSFTHASNLLTINLDRTYNPNEIVYVQINYQHLNVTDQAFYTGNGGVFTDAEPEGARKWFPCWDRPFDKATVDMTVKVPANVRIGSNGRLNDSTLTGDTLYYHWISRDPVATYLTVLTGKVNYNLNIVYYHKISNPSDSVPIRFYYNSGENPFPIQNIIADMTTYYATLFGEHPFEKNGFTTAPASGFTWGGMENQTLTTFCQGCWSANLTSHEFAHQWFGDAITCGTWADIWLNEGFATYCEALYYEHTGGYSSYKSDIVSDASQYLSSNPGWPMYNPSWAENTPPVNTLFNTAITYNKGACVLHMMRYVLGDATFFNVLHAYGTDTANFRYKNSVTDDFTAKVTAVAGQDMSWFVNEWVKEPNHPVYANIYQITTNSGSNWTVGFQAKQTQTNSVFHKMPIVVKISFTSGPDSSIRVMNDVNNQIWYWNFNRQPLTSNAVSFDPNNDIVLKQGTTTQGTIQAVNNNNNQLPFMYALYQNYPNPFNPVTKINFDLPERNTVTLKIYNVLGEVVAVPINNETKIAGNYSVEFNAVNLPSGVYYYELKAGNYSEVKKMVLIK